MKNLLFLITSILVMNTSKAQTTEILESDKIVGVWETGSGKARVKISKYGDKFGGKIVWLKEPTYPDGTKKVDKNNPDETKRATPLLGYNNLLGFSYKGKSEYDGGTIYDPENGNVYNCNISLKDDNTLEVRGYIGVSLFGRTDTWKRVTLKAK